MLKQKITNKVRKKYIELRKEKSSNFFDQYV